MSDADAQGHFAGERQRFASAAALEEFVGREPVRSPAMMIDQAAIDAFGSLTHDRQWIHVDPVRAAQAPMKTTIAHGFLTLSMLTHWHFQCFDYSSAQDLLNYGFDKIRFTGPVPSGAQVQASFALLRVLRVSESQVRCFWKVEVMVQGADKPAVVAEWVIQVRF